MFSLPAQLYARSLGFLVFPVIFCYHRGFTPQCSTRFCGKLCCKSCVLFWFLVAVTMLVFNLRFVDGCGSSFGCLGKTYVEFWFLPIVGSIGRLLLSHALMFSFWLETSTSTCLQVRLDGFLPSKAWHSRNFLFFTSTCGSLSTVPNLDCSFSSIVIWCCWWNVWLWPHCKPSSICSQIQWFIFPSQLYTSTSIAVYELMPVYFGCARVKWLLLQGWARNLLVFSGRLFLF